METAIVVMVVLVAAVVAGRRAAGNLRRGLAPRDPDAPPCAGGSCGACAPPPARLVQLRTRRS